MRPIRALGSEWIDLAVDAAQAVKGLAANFLLIGQTRVMRQRVEQSGLEVLGQTLPMLRKIR